MSLDWVARQIQAVRLQDEIPIPQIVSFNPRPPGAPIKGSATSAVLAVLQAHPLRWLTHQELVELANRGRSEKDQFSRVAVDWALIRMRGWGWLDTTSDSSRNSRYLRYRLNPKAPKSVKE